MSLDESSRLPVLPGETLAGTYRIERVLGEGGMGVVLLGRHLRLDKQVAIKLLRREAVRALGAPRFVQEARIAAKLKGDHVARVYDVDEVDGTPYLVMEYLEGSTLAGELDKQGPFSVERAVDTVLEACEALAEAHSLGIVHRDIKLENLFLARAPDGSSRLKLLDFGVSKVLGADSLTRTAALVGSPVYMAPEQLESSKDVDSRADIWSLGVVFYELLSGKQPFGGDTLPQLCVSIREHEAPSLVGLRPDVPAELDRVVQRCLAKRRQDRYPSVAELVLDLAPFASAKTQGSVESARRLVRAAAATVDFAESSPDVQSVRSEAPARTPSSTVAATISIAKPEPNRRRWLGAALVVVAVAVLAVGALRFGVVPVAEKAPAPTTTEPATARAPVVETSASSAPAAAASAAPPPEPVLAPVASLADPAPPSASPREKVRPKIERPAEKKPREKPTSSAPVPAPPTSDPLSEPH